MRIHRHKKIFDRLFWPIIVVLAFIITIAMQGLVRNCRTVTPASADFIIPSPVRLFHMDAVVGHNGDSPQHPSHFIALARNGSILVIEDPAGDTIHPIYYTIPYHANRRNITIIIFIFKDSTIAQKMDMIIRVDTMNFCFSNTGTRFRYQ